MQVSFCFDDEDGEFLSAYFRLAEGEVHQTVELSEGEWNVDLDSDGAPIGVEILCVEALKISAQRVSEKYNVKGLTKMVDELERTLAIT